MRAHTTGLSCFAGLVPLDLACLCADPMEVLCAISFRHVCCLLQCTLVWLLIYSSYVSLSFTRICSSCGALLPSSFCRARLAVLCVSCPFVVTARSLHVIYCSWCIRSSSLLRVFPSSCICRYAFALLSVSLAPRLSLSSWCCLCISFCLFFCCAFVLLFRCFVAISTIWLFLLLRLLFLLLPPLLLYLLLLCLCVCCFATLLSLNFKSPCFCFCFVHFAFAFSLYR